MGMAVEQPVVFTNRNGCKLFGMLYEPEAALSRRVGVLISVNAVKYRLGTFRLHTLLARKLCAAGYTVFSFDPAGIGDSEGEFESKLLTEHYYDIQTGKYDADLADAVGYVRSRCALDSLLLFGLCGGAISILMEASTDPRVDGLIMLNLPVFVEDLKRVGRENNAAKITSTESAAGLLGGKLQRLGEVDFWRRLVTLKVDLREEGGLVAKAVTVIARKSLDKCLAPIVRREKSELAEVPVSRNPLFNMHFQRSFLAAAAARKRMLFVFAELDPWTWIFKSEFQDAVLGPGNPYEPCYSQVLIRSANHIFSGTDSRRQLEECIVDWLARSYPGYRTAA